MKIMSLTLHAVVMCLLDNKNYYFKAVYIISLLYDDYRNKRGKKH